MKTVRGDLVSLSKKGRFDVLVHGCNCMCTMGAGIAVPIRINFPPAFKADCTTKKGDRDKLGTITHATISIQQPQGNAHRLTVVNGYTQYHWRGKGRLCDYEAVRGVMKLVKQEFSGLRIGYPKIGCGLAKGDWSIVAAIIDEELEGEDHTYVEFLPGDDVGSQSRSGKRGQGKLNSSSDQPTSTNDKASKNEKGNEEGAFDKLNSSSDQRTSTNDKASKNEKGNEEGAFDKLNSSSDQRTSTNDKASKNEKRNEEGAFDKKVEESAENKDT